MNKKNNLIFWTISILLPRLQKKSRLFHLDFHYTSNSLIIIIIFDIRNNQLAYLATPVTLGVYPPRGSNSPYVKTVIQLVKESAGIGIALDEYPSGFIYPPTEPAQPLLPPITEPLLAVRVERRCLRYRPVRRIQIIQRPGTAVQTCGILEIPTDYMGGALSQQCGTPPEIVLIQYPRIAVSPERHIELPLPVLPVKPVEACPVEEDEHRGNPNILTTLFILALIVPLPCKMKILLPSFRRQRHIFLLHFPQCPYQTLDIIPHYRTCRHQTFVDVVNDGMPDVWIFLKHVEQYRTASHERLYVSDVPFPEILRKTLLNLPNQLPLSASPLDERMTHVLSCHLHMPIPPTICNTRDTQMTFP